MPVTSLPVAQCIATRLQLVPVSTQHPFAADLDKNRRTKFRERVSLPEAWLNKVLRQEDSYLVGRKK